MSDNQKSGQNYSAAKDGAKKFISGGVGGICAVLSGHPFDTVKVSFFMNHMCIVTKAALI